jgi:hypothetical protein
MPTGLVLNEKRHLKKRLSGNSLFSVLVLGGG